jgi:predicted Zn finger-like uncharacterized protein
MKIRFVCPSCNASGTADAALSGRQVRCKPCNHRFVIPGPGESEAEGYAIEEPVERITPVNPEPASSYVPSRGKDPRTTPSQRGAKRARSGSGAGAIRERMSSLTGQTRLIRGGLVVVLVLAAIVGLAPSGTLVVTWLVMAVGSLMVLVGFGAGAYGAFREDVLYGILYLLVPLYTAYYTITRWDDLWPWFACSTAGAALVLLGTEMLRWNGMVA